MDASRVSDPEDYPLARPRSTSGMGTVFLNFGRQPRPLADQLGGMDERFRALGHGPAPAGKRIVYDVAANWKLIIHNYSECLHCPGVHPALQKLSHYLSGENEPAETATWGAGWVCATGSPRSRSTAGVAVACLPGLDDVGVPVRLFLCRSAEPAAQPAPGLRDDPHALAARGRTGPRSSASGCSTPTPWPRPDFDPDDAVAFWDLTNRQDWHVCEADAARPGVAGLPARPVFPPRGSAAGFDRLILELERQQTTSRPHRDES